MGYRDNEYGRIRQIILCKPDYFKWVAINEAAKENIKTRGAAFDSGLAKKQHGELVDALKSYDDKMKIQFFAPKEGLPYEVYTRDFGKSCAQGALIGKFRESVRDPETIIVVDFFKKHNLPLWERVQTGAIEGGDMHFIDGHTLAVGIGSRSNEEGVEEAKKLLAPKDINVMPVKFDPKYLHLDLSFVLINDRICVACPDVHSDSFMGEIKKRKLEIVVVPEKDLLELKCNVLSIDDETVLSFKANTEVNKKLRALGLKVSDPDLSMFTMGGGGPRCLTYPLERDGV